MKKADNAENIRKYQNSDQFPWRQKKVLYLLDDRRLLKISKNILKKLLKNKNVILHVNKLNIILEYNI